MTGHIAVSDLKVAPALFDLLERDILPGTGVASDRFWSAFSTIVHDFSPRNRALLDHRVTLQTQIDEWYRNHPGAFRDPQASATFLEQIGYLQPEDEPFTVATANVDPEIAHLAGPQLVVPVTNARFALNAANARWGSLYDALYGSDLIPETGGRRRGDRYNPVRGAAVVEMANDFLDSAAPLVEGSHSGVTAYRVRDGVLTITSDVAETALTDPSLFAGYAGNAESPTSILLKHHGLHIDIQIDRNHPVGSRNPAGVKDVVLEAALTTIQDFEDAVAAVDVDDKVLGYRHWLGLMKGDLEVGFTKGGKEITRRLSPDREFTAPDGGRLSLTGRSLMLVRNVGHLMTTDMILDRDGREVPEGIVDGMVTTACALHDLARGNTTGNSRRGSIYIVKPKMHGPQEVSFSNDLFDRVEDALGLERHTIKIGVMDEERRTTLNLKECIRAVKDRIVFINTGFLDRTGDEIHTSMEAGPFLPKEQIKAEPWIDAYERWNVAVGLECGFRGRAQIGKGMWTKTDRMAEMMETKVAHPRAGASCAWVPSPTAATLHALHYHQVDVSARQEQLAQEPRPAREDLLKLAVMPGDPPDAEAIQQELDNNVQGILGYVVRWIDQGIGCSKVPDIHDVDLMEDRATLRISSQHLANWLRHGICGEDQLMATLRRMARTVDTQNAEDPAYRPMAPDFDTSIAFQTAVQLIFKGRAQPNGYTEPLLHAHRRDAKRHNPAQ